jgi:ankyrin repeat protein
MAAFIDPRADPNSWPARPVAQTTDDPRALTELHRLCRDGRIYDVERWIQAGRPLQVDRATAGQRRLISALEIALEARNQALVLLLLCNGYDPNLEPDSPLDLALRTRRSDLLDLLLKWGAEPGRVSLSALFDSYDSNLFERFRTLGVDLIANHELAEALAYHTSNKPLFGFAKRYREHDPGIQKEINIALVHHAGEGNEKGALLCLWAGADPHAPAPDLRYPDLVDDEDSEDENDRFLGFTAIHEACRADHVQILERLGPDPSRDDFEDLYRVAGSRSAIELLARCVLPKDIGAVIRSQMYWITPPFGRPRSLDTLRSLFEAGGRWETASAENVADVRRGLLKMPDDMFADAMKLLAAKNYCSPAILQDLGRTPTMRARMRKVGFFPSPPNERQSICQYQFRPTRAREVLSKFGIEIPKLKPQLPRRVEIGAWGRDGHEIRLDRGGLFDRVWAEPVEKLAKEWGLSGRGLAKACQRLKIPVPPRGFWARVQNGQQVRRPRLPKLAPGEAEEIMIRVPE